MTALEGFARALSTFPALTCRWCFARRRFFPKSRPFARGRPFSRNASTSSGSFRTPTWRVFGAADLFLTSSPAEGSNFALLEALACRTTSGRERHPGAPRPDGERGGGRLFDVGDAESCARALVAVASAFREA